MSDRSPDLSPEARAIIDAAHGADEPTLADKNRVRAAVFAHVGVTAAATKATASAAGGSGGPGTTMNATSAMEHVPGSPAAPLGASKLFGLKLVVGVALVGGIGGYFLARGGGQAPATTPAETRMAVVEPPALAPVSATATATATMTNDEPGAGNEPAVPNQDDNAGSDEDDMTFEPVAVEPERRRPKRTPRPAPEPRAESATMDLAQALKEEQALIASAKNALDAGDPGRAMRALSEHASRFPRGILTEERSALRVMTLCARGDAAQADKERAAFLARWPRSPHAGRVRDACSE